MFQEEKVYERQSEKNRRLESREQTWLLASIAAE